MLYRVFVIAALLAAAHSTHAADATKATSGEINLSAIRLNIRLYSADDFQRSIKFQSEAADAPVLEGGAVIASKLNRLPGKPKLSVDVSSWKTATNWNPRKDPLWETDVKLGFQKDTNVKNAKIMFGPHITHSWSNGSPTKKKMYGLFLDVEF